ncbi:MAG: glycosyl transferase [Hyphomicrobiales bacterium]|nr:MAG: glycosyl transferase [Hyphomicrobiales bacterium]
MRLAFLTALIPVARPDTGFEIANAAILDALRFAGHEVTAFGFLRPGETPADPEGAVVIARTDIENAAVAPGRRLRWIIAALRMGLPVACAKLRIAGAGRLVEAVRAQGPFDAIILNSVMLPGAFPDLLRLGPCVLVEHNIEHVSARQSAAHARNPVLRRLFNREASLLERMERKLWQEVRFVWTLAQEDRAALGEAHQAKSAVLPLISNQRDEPHPMAGGEPEPAHDVGLIGTWTWTPNFIGLDWFLREVCPLLPSDITVAVAGRLPAGIRSLPPQVKLLGRVPAADAFLRSCRIVALSSRAGTGVQLKTIEALELGLPAVATTLSCRGFTTMPDNVTRADTPAEFAKAVIARVAAIRAGDRQRVDGAAFMALQRVALTEGLERGLAAART